MPIRIQQVDSFARPSRSGFVAGSAAVLGVVERVAEGQPGIPHSGECRVELGLGQGKCEMHVPVGSPGSELQRELRRHSHDRERWHLPVIAEPEDGREEGDTLRRVVHRQDQVVKFCSHETHDLSTMSRRQCQNARTAAALVGGRARPEPSFRITSPGRPGGGILNSGVYKSLEIVGSCTVPDGANISVIGGKFSDVPSAPAVDIDDDALSRAQRALNTNTKKDTVNEALAVVAALSARRRDLERFGVDAHSDLRDADIMSSAWQR